MKKTEVVSISMPKLVVKWMDYFIKKYNEGHENEPLSRSLFIVTAVVQQLNEVAPIKEDKAN